MRIDYIDGIPCIIHKSTSTIAKVSVINNVDFTLTPGYVAKKNGYFAHGLTIKEALADVFEKIANNMSLEEKVSSFNSHFSKGKKYKVSEFHQWHGTLTGSCKFGRDQWCTEHGYKMDQLVTVDEFLNVTKSEYGREVIEELLNANNNKTIQE